MRARDYLRSPLDPDILRQLGVALHDHAATLVHNGDGRRTAPARFEGMASTPGLAARYSRAFGACLIRDEMQRGRRT